MDYFILCFGRTLFTQATIDAIHARAQLKPRIHLINNGWNERLVPAALLQPWRDFVAAQLETGRIAQIIDEPQALSGAALNAFTIADRLASEPYYWISDNDCIIDTPGFDVVARSLMEQYPELPKLGIDFMRRVSRTHIASFEPHWQGRIDWLPQGGDTNIVADGDDHDFSRHTGKPLLTYKGDARITSNLSDTTLSIVRRGCRITQHQNRISYSIAGMRMLHIGYGEAIFSATDPAHTLEMLHYMNVRPHVLTEFAAAYESRKQTYIRNLTLNGQQQCIADYNRAMSS